MRKQQQQQQQQGGKKAPVDDSDLEDLLTAQGNNSNSIEVEEEEVETLLKHNGTTTTTSTGTTTASVGICTLLHAYLCLFFSRQPWLFLCLSIFLFFGFLSVFFNVVLNPKSDNSIQFDQDYSNLQSSFDLSMGKIHHWCLHGDNDSCRCDDPLTPRGRTASRGWVKAHTKNKKLVRSYRDQHYLDVAFLGESLVEEMDGRWMGAMQTEFLSGIERQFRKHFKKEEGAAYEGVALGIAGDTASNVLWRILNGEMPSDFRPKVWWLALGMNDLARMHCSEEVVVIGILRIVEEIHEQQPDAKIVINSLLPMTSMRGGLFPEMVEFADSLPKDKVKEIQASLKEKIKNKQNRKEAMKESRNHGGGRKRKHKKRNSQGEDQDGGRELLTDDQELRVSRYKEQHQKLLEFLQTRKKDLDLDDPEKMRKFSPLFLQRNRAPLWTSIRAINRQLKRFCQHHPYATFFDATDIFATRSDDGDERTYLIRPDMISIRGHPTEAGYKKWEKQVGKRLGTILEKIAPVEEDPEYVETATEEEEQEEEEEEQEEQAEEEEPEEEAEEEGEEAEEEEQEEEAEEEGEGPEEEEEAEEGEEQEEEEQEEEDEGEEEQEEENEDEQEDEGN